MAESTQAITDKLALLNEKVQQHKSHCEKHNITFIHHCPKCHQAQEGLGPQKLGVGQIQNVLINGLKEFQII